MFSLSSVYVSLCRNVYKIVTEFSSKSTNLKNFAEGKRKSQQHKGDVKKKKRDRTKTNIIKKKEN